MQLELPSAHSSIIEGISFVFSSSGPHNGEYNIIIGVGNIEIRAFAVRIIRAVLAASALASLFSTAEVLAQKQVLNIPARKNVSIARSSSEGNSAEKFSSKKGKSNIVSDLSKKIETRSLNESELKVLSDYLSSHPRDPEAHRLLARTYDLLGLSDLFVNELIQTWRLDRQDLVSFISAQSEAIKRDDKILFEQLSNEACKVYESDARSLLTIAAIHQRRGDDASARKFLQLALKVSPGDAETREYYLSALLAGKNYSELIRQSEILAKTGTRKRHKILAAMFKGIALSRLHQAEQSLPYLATAYKASPHNYDLATDYFRALLLSKKFKEAVEPGLMSLVLQPPFAATANTDLTKEQLIFLMKRVPLSVFDQGLLKVSAVISQSTQLSYFYFSLASLLDDCGYYQKAKEYYVAGLNLDDSDGKPFMRIARDMDLLGDDPDTAIDLYRAATLREPNNAEFRARLDRALVRSGNWNRDIAARIKTTITRNSHRK